MNEEKQNGSTRLLCTKELVDEILKFKNAINLRVSEHGYEEHAYTKLSIYR